MERLEGGVRRELARFGPPAMLGELVGVWSELVGDAIAANAWPARIARDGTLHVNTADSVWAFELGHQAPAILERLCARLGESAPRALRFRAGLLPEPAVSATEGPGRSPRSVTPSPEHLRQSAELTAGIEDPELRERVARAAAASLARAASDRVF